MLKYSILKKSFTPTCPFRHNDYHKRFISPYMDMRFEIQINQR